MCTASDWQSPHSHRCLCQTVKLRQHDCIRPCHAQTWLSTAMQLPMIYTTQSSAATYIYGLHHHFPGQPSFHLTYSAAATCCSSNISVHGSRSASQNDSQTPFHMPHSCDSHPLCGPYPTHADRTGNCSRACQVIQQTKCHHSLTSCHPASHLLSNHPAPFMYNRDTPLC